MIILIVTFSNERHDGTADHKEVAPREINILYFPDHVSHYTAQQRSIPKPFLNKCFPESR